MEKSFVYNGEKVTIRIAGNPSDGPVSADVGERSFVRSIKKISAHEMLIRNGTTQTRVFIASDRDGTMYIHQNGRQYVLSRPDEEGASSGGAGGSGSDGRLTAVMPGKVIKIMVEMDQIVDAGEPVLILESMKMENTQEAPFKGRVVEINAQPGEQVDAGTVIVRLEPVEGSSD